MFVARVAFSISVSQSKEVSVLRNQKLSPSPEHKNLALGHNCHPRPWSSHCLEDFSIHQTQESCLLELSSSGPQGLEVFSPKTQRLRLLD